MFGIDGHKSTRRAHRGGHARRTARCIDLGRHGHNKIAAHDQAFFIRKRKHLASGERLIARTQTGGAHQSVHHNVGLFDARERSNRLGAKADLHAAMRAREARVTRTGVFLDALTRTYRQQGVALSDATTAARLGVEQPLFDPQRLRTAFVRGGDTVTVGRYELQVVDTPGHTPGHPSLFEPQSRILFGGDHALFVISPSIALFPREGDGLQAYLDSIKRVQDLHISQLFHSHGPIRPDFEQRLDWLAQHHLKRLDEVCGIVARNPRLSGYQIIRAIRWNVPFDDWEDIPIMQRYIMLTQGIVYLKHLVADGSIKVKTYGDGIQLYESVR